MWRDRRFWALLVRRPSLDCDGQFCLAGLARFSTTTQWQLMPKIVHSNTPGLRKATRSAAMPAIAAIAENSAVNARNPPRPCVQHRLPQPTIYKLNPMDFE